jgi:hypothetical protein
MRLLIRTHPSVVSPSLGLITLTAGVIVAWIALRRWRWAAPIRCATVVGLSGGLAGAGLVMLLGYVLAFLFTPVGPLQR